MTATIRPASHHATLGTSRFQEMADRSRAVVGFRDDDGACTTLGKASHRVAFQAMDENGGVFRRDPAGPWRFAGRRPTTLFGAG